MKQKFTITLIIPFYNEGTRTLRALKHYSQYTCFENIIAVNDGSTDRGEQLVKKHYPDITLLSYKKNKGKGHAIKTALKHVHTDYVYLADADSVNLKQQEIEPMLKKATKDSVSLLLFRKVRTVTASKILLFDLLFPGERLIRTDDLRSIYKQYKPTGYDVELLINKYMRVHKKNVVYTPVSLRNTFKYKKYPFTTMLKRESRMIAEIAKKNGTREYLTQCYWARTISQYTDL